MAKKLLVINSDVKERISFTQLTGLQGGLKKRTVESLSKLKKSIVKHGFIVPIFIWENIEDATLRIIDGHGRVEALESLKKDGYSIPEIPIVFVKADNLKDAKEKLLVVASQYGKFDRDGAEEFFAGLDLEFAEIELPEIKFNSEPEKIQVSAHDRTVNDYKETELPDISNADAPDFKQMVFIVHTSQVKTIEYALAKAKRENSFDEELNENSNGNALFYVAKSYGK